MPYDMKLFFYASEELEAEKPYQGAYARVLGWAFGGDKKNRKGRP